MGLVQSTEEESMEDDSTMDHSKDDDGLLRSGVTVWKGLSNPWRIWPLEVLGMSITPKIAWKILGWSLKVVVKHLLLVEFCFIHDYISL